MGIRKREWEKLIKTKYFKQKKAKRNAGKYLYLLIASVTNKWIVNRLMRQEVCCNAMQLFKQEEEAKQNLKEFVVVYFKL